MSGRRLVVLVVLTAAGAAVYGLPGAFIGYVGGMVVSAFLPEKACDVPPAPPPEDPVPTPEAD